MRLFVGLDIPDAIRERIRAYVDELKAHGAAAKWTDPAGWHITLKFIGWTQRASEVRAALQQVAASPFPVTFQGVGFFTPQKPRVFYAGVEASSPLPELAARIDQAVVRCGVKAEEKAYSPHLTLARFGSGNPHGASGDRQTPVLSSLKDVVARRPELRHPQFGTMTANEFILYLSELSPRGAKYTALERYQLRG